MSQGADRAAFCTCALIAIIMWCVGAVLGSKAEPNGDLELFYAVETCPNSSASFRVGGSLTWDVNVLRAGSTTPGLACSQTPTTEPVQITLEESDGYRTDSSYSPIVLLQTGSYAYFSFSIVDANGALLLPDSIVSIGPDNYYPWTAGDTVPVTTHLAPVASPFAPPRPPAQYQGQPP